MVAYGFYPVRLRWCHTTSLVVNYQILISLSIIYLFVHGNLKFRRFILKLQIELAEFPATVCL